MGIKQNLQNQDFMVWSMVGLIIFLVGFAAVVLINYPEMQELKNEKLRIINNGTCEELKQALLNDKVQGYESKAMLNWQLRCVNGGD